LNVKADSGKQNIMENIVLQRRIQLPVQCATPISSTSTGHPNSN